MAPIRTPGVLGGATGRATLDTGTLCRAQTPLPGTASRLAGSVAEWDTGRKLLEAAKLATPKLPAEMQGQFAALFEPQNIAITAGVLALWAGSHAFGVGAVADAVMFLGGLILLGAAAIDVAGEFKDYVVRATQAQSMRDLDEASSHLAKVVTVLGITVFSALLMKGAKQLRSTKGARPAVPTVEGPPPRKIYQKLFPPDVEFGGDGVMAQAMRRALAEEHYKDIPKFAGNRAKDAAGKIIRRDGARINNRAERASHIDGIDLTKHVVRRTLPRGREIIQYEGKYGPGYYATYDGVRPEDVAILVEGRILKRYVVTDTFHAMESTAAAFEAGRVAGVAGKGGGRQLLLPADWLSHVKLVWQSGPLPKGSR